MRWKTTMASGNVAPAQDNSEMVTGKNNALYMFRSDCLEQGTEVYDFVTRGDLKRRVGHAKDELDRTTHDQYIVFHHVSPEIAESIWENSISLVGRSRLAYDAASNVLIVKIVSRPHEVPTRRIEVVITAELISMGLEDELCFAGASRVRSGRSGKEPNGSYLPRTLPQGRTNEWPSLACGPCCACLSTTSADCPGALGISIDRQSRWREVSEGHIAAVHHH
ncbi:hypothetical protein VTO42DRAFT_5745 [Malbranchea cinnamomea]